MTSVAARDKNNPPHNQVKNTMKDDSGAFSINGTTGDIFLHSALDRETFSSDLGLNSRLGEEAASFTIDLGPGQGGAGAGHAHHP